jgi:hypothetical protein
MGLDPGTRAAETALFVMNDDPSSEL